MTTKKSKHAYPPCKPIDPQGMTQLVTYLEQAERHLKDPKAQAPDLNLLCIPHGPLPIVAIGPNEWGEIGIKANVRNSDRQPRWFNGPSFLAIHLLLAFGGGVTVNDTGNGHGYWRLLGGKHNVDIGRVLKDAKPGEVVRQTDSEGNRIEHRTQHPDFFHKVPVEVVRSEGRKTKTPYKGRGYAISVALDYFRRNAARSGIKLTEGGYLSLLNRAFALLDALHGDPQGLGEAA